MSDERGANVMNKEKQAKIKKIDKDIERLREQFAAESGWSDNEIAQSMEAVREWALESLALDIEPCPCCGSSLIRYKEFQPRNLHLEISISCSECNISARADVDRFSTINDVSMEVRKTWARRPADASAKKKGGKKGC